MTLEKFLESKPELVKKIDVCKSKEEIIKVIKAEVSPEELENVEVSDLPRLEKMSMDYIANINSGGIYSRLAYKTSYVLLDKIGKIIVSPEYANAKIVFAVGYMVFSFINYKMAQISEEKRKNFLNNQDQK